MISQSKTILENCAVIGGDLRESDLEQINHQLDQRCHWVQWTTRIKLSAKSYPHWQNGLKKSLSTRDSSTCCNQGDQNEK